ncbi:MAG: mercury resistance system periplasmic binding protein MerP [Gammaproteobacteria bacterium]
MSLEINMRKLPLGCATVVMALVASLVSAAEKTVTLSVNNMTCATCPPVVKKSLGQIDGVSRVEVSLEAKTAIVTYDDAKTDVAALIGATTNAGYPSHVAK